MTRPSALWLFASLSFGLLIAPAPLTAQGGDVRSIPVSTFATLPLVAPLNPGNPEGMTSDDFGLLHVNTFDTSNICFSLPASPPNAFNYIFTYDRSGRLLTQTPFVPCGAPLGMQAVGDKLYVIDVFYGQVDRYQLPLTDTSTPDATYNVCGGFLVAFGLPVKNGGPFCALNDLKLGPDGRLYIADNGAGFAFVFSNNFGTGHIWVLNPHDGTSGLFYSNDVLNVDPNSAPPFGVAAAVFDPAGKKLFMSNFSTSFVFTLDVQPVDLSEPPSPANPLVPPTGSPTILYHDPSVLLGPNHMAFDGEKHLWITAGENNRVVELDSRNGDVLATAGSFCGLTDDGAPQCLLQPANIVKLGNAMYVDNEANPGLNCLNAEAGAPGSLVPAGLAPLCGPGVTPSSTWTDLKLFTISRFFPNGKHRGQ